MPEKSKTYEKKSPRVYIRTFGCQMNDRDSEALLGLFLQKGYSRAKSEKSADVILVNTCSVRGHAENRALSLLGTYKKLKQSKVQSPKSKVNNEKNEESENKKNSIDYGLSTMDCSQRRKPIVGLIGCMARNRGREVFSKMPHIDLVCGPAGFNKIPGYVGEILNSKPKTLNKSKIQNPRLKNSKRKAGRKRVIDLRDEAREDEFYEASFRVQADHAQVVISTGCSNFCSYCVVPYTRGKLRPRDPDKIISEIKENIKQGRRKITLLGQNVNDYYSPKSPPAPRLRRTNSVQSPKSFVGLLREINKIEGLEELGFVTSHPKNTSEELFKVMAKSDKIRKHLHLPFQSGSNRILKLMGRGYIREKYIELTKQYKKITGGTLGTDIMVGFPTETEEDFAQTRDLVKQVKFRYAFIFKYSSRFGTEAAKMKDDVAKAVKKRRHKELLDLQKEISASLNV